MVYVVTPEGAIDPCKRVIVFADRIGSYHVRKPPFTRTMLFVKSKLHAEQTVAFPQNVAGTFHEPIAKHQRLIVVSFSVRPSSLWVWKRLIFVLRLSMVGQPRLRSFLCVARS